MQLYAVAEYRCSGHVSLATLISRLPNCWNVKHEHYLTFLHIVATTLLRESRSTCIDTHAKVPGLQEAVFHSGNVVLVLVGIVKDW